MYVFFYKKKSIPSNSLEMGVRHKEDKRHGTLYKVNYDTVLSLDGFDTTDTSFEWAVNYENFTCILELLEFLCRKYSHIFVVLLQRKVQRC